MGSVGFLANSMLLMESLPNRLNSFIIGLVQLFDTVKNHTFPTLYFWLMSKNWIYLFYIQNFLCTIPLIFLFYYVEESPRWLNEKKRHQDLKAVIN